MIKMYNKEGKVAEADAAQIAIMEKAGWSRTVISVEEAPEEVIEKETMKISDEPEVEKVKPKKIMKKKVK